MNLQYGTIFKYPRRGFKYFLSFLYPVIIKIYPLPKIMSIPDTIDKLITDGCSICRFGDGELLYLAEKRSLPFQKQNSRLRQYFKDILVSDYDHILIGLPVGYYSLKNLKPSSRLNWRAIISWTYPTVNNYLKKDKIYYNASMTRLYMDYQDRSHSQIWFKKIMCLWQDRDIILVEGEKSRLGIGNNLFEKAKSIKRIIGPAHDAFDQFDSILTFSKTQSKNALYLIAMGPTAKPLAFELALTGRQAIDIGNLDIEYEWFLRKAKEKIKINGKYVNEVKGGRNVIDIHDDNYKKQIIAKFLNEA